MPMLERMVGPASHERAWLLEPCSFGLSATSQQYFSLRTHQHQQPVSSTFLSEHISTSHQPNEQVENVGPHLFYFEICASISLSSCHMHLFLPYYCTPY
jgi:hypothetical protein